MDTFQTSTEGKDDYIMAQILGDGIWVENSDTCASAIFLSLNQACDLRDYLNKLIEEVV